jgi:hypothetical protein
LPTVFSDQDSLKGAGVSCLMEVPKKLPTLQEWTNAYLEDKDTSVIYVYLKKEGGKEWPNAIISKVNPVYRPYLRDNRISYQNGRLVAFQKLSASNRPLVLVIVPEGLQRIIFEAYHANPTSGHLGEYKTLHRIRLRFLFPDCRKKVKEWVNKCPDCIMSRSGAHPHSELVYSWPVSSPFFILHLDVWAPGESESAYGFKYLLAAMCDLTGFVLLAEINDTTAATMAMAFMMHVLLRVGFCGVVVPDAASGFKAEFKEMCESLGLLYHDAARGNHKAVSVERFFRFLNKSMAIASEARGTNKVMVENAHLTGYAWNASVIDGTNIVRSVAAVGRPFRFPFDAELMGESDKFLQQVESNNPRQISRLHEYLRLGQAQGRFAVEILRLLTEERRMSQSERVNALREPGAFKEGDIVTVRVQMNSKAETDTVAKISFRRRGPYKVVKADGNGAYFLRKLGGPASETSVKHMAENLELLPPNILPCEPIDSADQRFLDMHYAPKYDPFKKHLGIEGYNVHWFDDNDKPEARRPPTIDNAVSEDNGEEERVEEEEEANVGSEKRRRSKREKKSPMDVPSLDEAIRGSRDRLFFIAYRHPNTLRPRWHLVQVDLEQTDRVCGTSERPDEGHYYCHFYNPPDDDEKKLSHPNCRWWPIWHEYKEEKGVIVYGSQVRVTPNQTPSPDKMVAWADVVNLGSGKIRIIGPFDFENPSSRQGVKSSSYKQYVQARIWNELFDECDKRGIIPPRLLTGKKEESQRRD